MTYRPGGTRVVAYGAAAALVAMTVAIVWALPAEIRAEVTPFQAVTLLGTIAAMIGVLHGIGRSSVTADDDGITVLNGYRRRHVPWQRIEGFSYGDGAPWPTLVTTGDERVMLFALQASSGRAEVRRVVEDWAGRAGR